MTPTLVVLAKQPLPGRVKTRLSPELSPHQAARLAAAALRDTLRVVGAARASSRVLCFEGDPEGWLPPAWTARAQCAGGLDARLADALGAVHGPALLVGMDTPQLTTELLGRFDPTRYDACLGPTADGGYWAIGLRDTALAGAALLGVPMSTEHTYAAQLERLRSLGLRVQVLDPLIDVDHVPDVWAVAALAPDTAFAQIVAQFRPNAA